MCRYFSRNTYIYLLSQCHYSHLCVGIFYEIPTNTYWCMCHYRSVFCWKCLQIRHHIAATHRRLITIASPSHRRNASALHRVAARNAGDLSTSLESHRIHTCQWCRCRLVARGRSGASANSAAGSGPLGRATMRILVEVMVERLWLDDAANVISGAPSEKEYCVEALHSTINAKSAKNQTVICKIPQQ